MDFGGEIALSDGSGYRGEDLVAVQRWVGTEAKRVPCRGVRGLGVGTGGQHCARCPVATAFGLRVVALASVPTSELFIDIWMLAGGGAEGEPRTGDDKQRSGTPESPSSKRGEW